MLFIVKLTKKAQKGYESLILEDYRKKINILLLTLAGDSYPAKIYDMIKLNENTCRIRLGRVRVQYTVFENENVILVYKIELRDDSTYKS